MDMSDTFITLAEAETQYGIEQETLKKKCQAGQIVGAIKKGKTWLVPALSVTGKLKLKAGVYVDGSNIYHGGKKAGWMVDYGKLRAFVERKYTVSIMSYYNSTGYKQDQSGRYIKDPQGKYVLDEGAVRFENGLRGLGIRVITKPLKFILGDEHKPSNKTDGDLMIDAFVEQQQWDELLLLAGDCDFEKLVKQLVSIAKPVHIFSFESRMSHELRVLAFQSPYVTYTRLEDMESILKYEKKTE